VGVPIGFPILALLILLIYYYFDQIKDFASLFYSRKMIWENKWRNKGEAIERGVYIKRNLLDRLLEELMETVAPSPLVFYGEEGCGMYTTFERACVERNAIVRINACDDPMVIARSIYNAMGFVESDPKGKNFF
jgi:hypothetical protein